MPERYKFISLEDEIILRRAVRIAYEHEGWIGLYKCMGEMSRSLEIIGEVALEINEEEKKKKEIIMVRDDQDWQNLVRNIANGSANTRENIHEAAGYLWDSYNWERLKNTSFGRFLREVNNECPDVLLRARYRQEVLTNGL